MTISQDIILRRIATIAAVIAESDEEVRQQIEDMRRQLDDAAGKVSLITMSEDKTTAEKEWREYCNAIVEFKVLEDTLNKQIKVLEDTFGLMP